MYPSGDFYKGQFVDGYQEGEGSLKSADGGLYVGSWRKGKYNGHGTKTFKYG